MKTWESMTEKKKQTERRELFTWQVDTETKRERVIKESDMTVQGGNGVFGPP